jgi:hypothetical protein
MKKSKNLLLFAILTTILFCTATCRTQVKQEAVQINERLTDGSIILTIDGVKYRALTIEQLRKVQEMSVSFQSCVKENETLTGQNENLKAVIQKKTEELLVADAQINNAQSRADEFKKMLEDERKLRLDAEKLPKKQNVIEKILNHPITQVILVGVAGVIAAKGK